MNRFYRVITALFLLLPSVPTSYAQPTPPEGYLFAYGTEKNDGRNGLHLAWSIDGAHWQSIGPEYAWIKCDYSRWGSEKRMVDPVLLQGADGTWHLVWSLNEYDGAVAHAASKDLVYWGPQDYIPVMTGGNCRRITAVPSGNGFRVTWESIAENGQKTFYEAETPDFKTYSSPRTITSRNDTQRVTARINGAQEAGTVHRVPWAVIDHLKTAWQAESFRQLQNAETLAADRERFANLRPVEANITFDATQEKKISSLLMGVFYEDINYAADGGLYAELVQNRDFEYDPADVQNRNPDWNPTFAWSFSGQSSNWKIETENPIHSNNRHYSRLTIVQPGQEKFVNAGFDGIPLVAGDKYDLSFFARISEGSGNRMTVRLIGKNGEALAEGRSRSISGSSWKKYELTLTSKGSLADATLELIPENAGTIDLDMVSLFPQKTFNGRKNGLRADLAQTIADMKPRFVRFPGGCVAHGDGIENMYNWKNTVGPLESRVPNRNQWNYHQTVGLGYYEYFQFCEDIGAHPIPIVPAGVPCQNSAHHHHALGGQQGGIPMEEMDEYIQDILDLIEWANGDKNTKWGKVRAEAGHPEPFGLKYLGVGNEDQITTVFEERYKMIHEAITEKHPEIVIIGTAGPFYQGTDYVEGWRIAREVGMEIIDEHYYNPPGWFINNQNFYDKYDRNGTKVYLGEYAAHVPGRHNNIESALAEALYLTALERNGDIVEMTSYAPLLAKHGHTQWNPDLIYFNNTEVLPTVGYHVQKLYGVHSGDSYIPSEVILARDSDPVRKRIGVSLVRDSESGDLILKLVNLLPKAVNTNIDLGNDVRVNPEAARIVLQGEPTDRDAAPVESGYTVSNRFDYELPPYSFTILRIKTAH